MKRTILCAVLGCLWSNCATSTAGQDAWDRKREEEGRRAQACSKIVADAEKEHPVPPGVDARIARLGPRHESIVGRPFCERMRTWQAFVDALPPSDKQKYESWKACREDRGQPTRMHFFGGDLAIMVQADRQSLIDEADSSVDSAVGRGPFATIAEYVDGRKCAGLRPDPVAEGYLDTQRRREDARRSEKDAEAARIAAEDERHRCLAEPVCKAEMEKKELANVTARLCDELAQHQGHRDAIKEEWRQAREETGLVDVENLRRERSLKVMHEEEIASLEHGYRELTGKPFNAKKACKAR